jgi:hypothetical protein
MMKAFPESRAQNKRFAEFFEQGGIHRVLYFAMQSEAQKLWRATAVSFASLLIASFCWIPLLHVFFAPTKHSLSTGQLVSAIAREMAEGQLRIWRDPALKSKELERMRRSNSEWDFMGRTFLALSLAEMSVRDPSLCGEHLPIIDSIIDETVALEKQRGMHFFLMPYSQGRPYRVQPERSLFIDGEIALMLATRRVVEEKEIYKEQFRVREKLIEERLARNPLMAVESYPDECWLFDHAIALAALRVGDYLDQSDHREVCAKWISIAKERLTHGKSGLFVSSYTTDGHWLDGPEGSSIWGAAHFLKFVDEEVARQQYAHARHEIGRTLLGFGWSREWPLSWRNTLDVDSGAVIPIVDASAGASGMALIGAASFGDSEFDQALRASLNFAAFPVRNHGALRYSASNAVGDAALLYAETLGAIYEKVRRPAAQKQSP